ncbi:MAG TPA: hypothetical protein PKI01_06515 [Bacteroidales bacterium]|nr:hypothetical protein [Bacteroidales bacterium]
MANFQIAFDNTDLELGHYFEASKDDLVVFINQNFQNPCINEIPSQKCNCAYIDYIISLQNTSNFLFLAYSHGNTDRLIANGEAYIRTGQNAHLFENSFFYSMSCLSAQVLGPALINEHNCLAFIGYNDESYAFDTAYKQLCIECDNFGIKKFIGGLNIGEAYNQMKDYFTFQVDILENAGEIIYAALLRKNRDCLVLIGDQNLLFNLF